MNDPILRGLSFPLRFAQVTRPRQEAPEQAALSGGVWKNVAVTESQTEEPREMPDVHSWHVPRLLTAWAVAAIIGTLVTILVPNEDRFAWLVFAIGASTLVTFGLQLGTAQREGFITRVAFSVAGSVLVIGVIDVIGLLVD